MDKLTAALFCFALFASANAFFPLIPEGKELIYHYHGVIGAGTDVPASFASSFVLDGNLHLQTDKNSSYLHFSDLKYKLHNGEQDWWHEFEAKELQMPKELEVLLHPFKVVYEPCGHALGIVVELDEPQWSVNIKRGIASMMQLYTEKIQWDNKSPNAFNCKERTLYGKGLTYYTVYPEADHWTVKKVAEPRDSNHLYSHLGTNLLAGSCDAHHNEPITRDSMQTYKIITKDGQHIMESMESNGGLYYTPDAGESFAYYIYMNQTLHLKKIEEVTQLFAINSPKYYNGLTYYYGNFDTTQGVVDVFNGQRKFDMDKTLEQLEEMLYDTMKYLQENHMDTKEPDWQRSQLVNDMLHKMFHLDMQHLEAMTDKLLQKTGDEDKDVLHIYYHMLPMIGTYASSAYMMKMIKAKKVKDKLALEWLQEMPAYAKFPNKMYVENMRDMLYWSNEISEDVRRAGIIAFGSFIKQAVFAHNQFNHINNWSGHTDENNDENFTPDHEMNTLFPGPKYFAKYVAHLGEKLKLADNKAMRSAYISALYNTKLEDAIEHLLPIAKGELFNDNFLRLNAIMSVRALIPKHNDALQFEIFWPIMTDYKLNTNLRVAAYLAIMKSHPPMQRMINLYWHMVNEENPVFYKFHYSFLQYIVQSVDPCYEHFRNIVKQIMRYTERIDHPGLSGVHSYEYMDTKYQYGHQLGGWLIHKPSESETTFKLYMDSTVQQTKLKMYRHLLHIQGLEASIFEDVALYVNDPNKGLNFEKVWKAYQNIYNNKDFKLTFITSKYGQVTMSHHYDASNIKDFHQFLDLFFADKFSYIKKYFSITYPIQTTMIMPTELGYPALFKAYFPQANFFDLKMSKDIINNMIKFQFDGMFKQWTNGYFGLSFFNSFVDSFQGVQRYQLVDTAKPLYFDLSMNPSQKSMKLTWKRHQDVIKDTHALKAYAATFTFVRDDDHTGLLQASSPQSKNWRMVTFGNHHNDRVLRESDNPNTGYSIMLQQFGSDAYMPNVSLINPISFLHHTQNYHTWHSLRVLEYLHLYTHLMWQPQPAANGMIWTAQPSKQYPVTNIDINLRLTSTNTENQHVDSFLTPAVKYNVRATYAVHNNDVLTRSWDANLIWDVETEESQRTLKGVLSRTIPGQKEWRVCVDGMKKYTPKGMDASMTFAMSHSADPKCSEDEKIMDVKIKGEKLPEQLENKHTYGECYEKVWSDLHELNSLDCYYARDSLRKWTYDFNTYNMPTEFKKFMQKSFDWMKMMYMNYFTVYEEASQQLDKDSWRVVHEYPMIGHKVDMYIYTANNDYKFSGIPSWKYPFYNLHMANTLHFNQAFRWLHKLGWTKTCEIHDNAVTAPQGEHVMVDMPADWTMYLGTDETDAKRGVWVKKVGEQSIGLKLVHTEHALEIVPTGQNMYEITVDGKKLPAETYQYEAEKWMWIDWTKETGVVTFFSVRSGINVLYDGHHVLIEVPNLDMPVYGHCAWK